MKICETTSTGVFRQPVLTSGLGSPEARCKYDFANPLALLSLGPRVVPPLTPGSLGSVPLTACVVCHSSGLTVWEPERTLLLSSAWGGVPPPGTEHLCKPTGGSLAPQLPRPVSLRVSTLPGKSRTLAGHLPAPMGTWLSAQLREILPEPLPHSAVLQGQG